MNGGAHTAIVSGLSYRINWLHKLFKYNFNIKIIIALLPYDKV